MSSTQAAPRRADARRNIAAILDAATECLARDPDTSLQEVAQAAGVGRVTLYGHFESRAGLVEAVVERAMRQTEEDLSAVDLTGDPAAAMARLMEVTWDLTHRFGALVVAAQQALPPERVHAMHAAPSVRVSALLRRGRRSGAFRSDVPVAWQLTTVQGLLHGASQAVHRGEIKAAQARTLVAETVLAALAPQGEVSRRG